MYSHSNPPIRKNVIWSKNNIVTKTASFLPLSLSKITPLFAVILQIFLKIGEKKFSKIIYLQELDHDFEKKKKSVDFNLHISDNILKYLSGLRSVLKKNI